MAKKSNIIKILLENSRVNNYTKLLIYLNTLDYYKEYYIPNKKLMNFLKIRKNKVILLLHQLEEDNIITLHYKNRKRYFTFIYGESERKEIPVIYDYDWLNE